MFEQVDFEGEDILFCHISKYVFFRVVENRILGVDLCTILCHVFRSALVEMDGTENVGVRGFNDCYWHLVAETISYKSSNDRRKMLSDLQLYPSSICLVPSWGKTFFREIELWAIGNLSEACKHINLSHKLPVNSFLLFSFFFDTWRHYSHLFWRSYQRHFESYACRYAVGHSFRCFRDLLVEKVSWPDEKDWVAVVSPVVVASREKVRKISTFCSVNNVRSWYRPCPCHFQAFCPFERSKIFVLFAQILGTTMYFASFCSSFRIFKVERFSIKWTDKSVDIALRYNPTPSLQNVLSSHDVVTILDDNRVADPFPSSKHARNYCINVVRMGLRMVAVIEVKLLVSLSLNFEWCLIWDDISASLRYSTALLFQVSGQECRFLRIPPTSKREVGQVIYVYRRRKSGGILSRTT